LKWGKQETFNEDTSKDIGQAAWAKKCFKTAENMGT
jgi:hypothetical protein